VNSFVATLLATRLVLASGATAPLPPQALPPPASETQEMLVRDGGAWRVFRRQARSSDDSAKSVVLYLDPASGRSTMARASRGVIVAVDVVSAREAHGVLSRLGLHVVRPLFVQAGLWLVQSHNPGEDGVALAARLAREGVVGRELREAFPDLELRHRLSSAEEPGVPPDDPRYAGQWYLREIDIEGAWEQSTGDPDVVVTIVDNGCDVAHPDLQAKLEPGHDVVDDDDEPQFGRGTGNEHGTACAGLVAAVTDNARDIAGACPRCRASCTRLLGGSEDDVPLSADVSAFSLAFADDVDVVSNSWGFIDSIPVPQVLADAIIHVQQRGRGGLGAVVVFASGNDNREIADDELLAVPGILGVGAVNNLGELTQFSNFGLAVDIVAPTGTITLDISGPDGAGPGDVTTSFGGTSSACPLVAGVAGLVLSVRADVTADEVNALLAASARQSLFATPDDDGHDVSYGYGLVQPAAALQEATAGAESKPGTTAQEDEDLPASGCATTSLPANSASWWIATMAVGAWSRRRRIFAVSPRGLSNSVP
jgi:serine protease